MDITAQMLSDEGYAVLVTDEDNPDTEKVGE